MSAATPLPRQGEVFFDARGPERALRLSRHPDTGVVVLSIWNGGRCQATFRLPDRQVGALAEVLLSGQDGYGPPPYPRPGLPPFPQTGQYEPPGRYEPPPAVP